MNDISIESSLDRGLNSVGGGSCTDYIKIILKLIIIAYLP